MTERGHNEYTGLVLLGQKKTPCEEVDARINYNIDKPECNMFYSYTFGIRVNC